MIRALPAAPNGGSVRRGAAKRFFFLDFTFRPWWWSLLSRVRNTPVEGSEVRLVECATVRWRTFLHRGRSRRCILNFRVRADSRGSTCAVPRVHDACDASRERPVLPRLSTVPAWLHCGLRLRLRLRRPIPSWSSWFKLVKLAKGGQEANRRKRC